MKIQIAFGLALTMAFAIGFITARSTDAAEEIEPAAYIVVSSKLLKPEAMGAYREAAGPLAQAAGIEILAGRPNPEVTLLEGEWPYAEGIVIERFRSMQALKDFWFSDAYQQAKKLREGASKINFIIAVEGVPVTSE